MDDFVGNVEMRADHSKKRGIEVCAGKERVAEHYDELIKLRRQMKELKDFVVEAIGGQVSWSLLPAEWQEDTDVAVAAMTRNEDDPVHCRFVYWTDLPDGCRTDRNVILAALQSHNDHLSTWDDVPVDLQTDQDVAFAAWKTTWWRPTMSRGWITITFEKL